MSYWMEIVSTSNKKVGNNGDISTCYQPFDSDIVEIQSMVEISTINRPGIINTGNFTGWSTCWSLGQCELHYMRTVMDMPLGPWVTIRVYYWTRSTYVYQRVHHQKTRRLPISAGFFVFSGTAMRRWVASIWMPRWPNVWTRHGLQTARAKKNVSRTAW